VKNARSAFFTHHPTFGERRRREQAIVSEIRRNQTDLVKGGSAAVKGEFRLSPAFTTQDLRIVFFYHC
jgi:hypothetical protein